ncbi:MAG: ABC transporter ATP-binding protein [Deltaproteobacteria bacterium]|nr:ABC transporter ATP-binding protein [Deltaproteobacteria bacterium]
MNEIAIHVKNLSKKYRIGQRQRHNALRDKLTDAIYTNIRRLSQLANGQSATDKEGNRVIWALKDVSLEVKRGEAVGIIGPNGAGKSTLLKILTRITEPTEGYADIYGRVGSLLEVGTGFHSELTGRENIYLNGAILGMKKAEIDRKFDEIVAFSEIEKFIDTPVKRYSSGMYMRLAFAVAAHLEPEILLVDEVLSVGDASFQKKCFTKMEEIRHQGRTILFVSHNLGAITRLCQRTILLEEGSISADGPSHQVISSYLSPEVGTTAERIWADPEKAPQGEIVRLRAVRVRSVEGHLIDTIDIRQPLKVEMEYEVLKPDHIIMPHFAFYNEEGVLAFSAHDLDPVWRRRPRPKGIYVSTAWIPGNLLADGTFSVGAGVDTIDPIIFQFYEYDAIAFHVNDSLESDSSRGDFTGDMGGILRPMLKWSTQFNGDEYSTKQHSKL